MKSTDELEQVVNKFLRQKAPSVYNMLVQNASFGTFENKATDKAGWARWESRSGRKNFCYNTSPLKPTPQTKNRRWAAWIYKVNKSKGTFTMTKVVYFASRKAAKNRALKWYWKHEARIDQADN